MSDKQFRSILDELDSFMPERTKYKMVEVRGDNIIRSTIHLLEDIKKNFNEKEYGDLKKKILNAINAEDPSKFTNKVRKFEQNENE